MHFFSDGFFKHAGFGSGVMLRQLIPALFGDRLWLVVWSLSVGG